MTNVQSPPSPPANPRSVLEAHAAALLDPATSYGDLQAASQGLYDLCVSLTGVLEDNQNMPRPDTLLGSGAAISPRNAARCVWDFMRTSRFLQGAYAGIHEAQRRFPGQRIEVLYAGCGPFAALAIPLLPLFAPNELHFTMIDIHADALDSVAQLLAAFDLGDFQTELVVGDATAYQPPDGARFHLLVSETMQKALDKEPQVAITRHLAPFLHPGGILIPERIVVSACLSNDGREFGELPRQRHELGVLVDLSLDSLDVLQPRRITIPADLPAGLNTFFLLTAITTFGTITLGDYDSGLSYPTVLGQLSLLEPGAQIDFQYQLGERPGLIYTVTAAEC
jgi:hypothetical protein